jgi:hypothetical protein
MLDMRLGMQGHAAFASTERWQEHQIHLTVIHFLHT